MIQEQNQTEPNVATMDNELYVGQMFHLKQQEHSTKAGTKIQEHIQEVVTVSEYVKEV